MRLAAALGALALGAGGFTVTTLPRPGFQGPAAAPSGPHRLVLVSSRPQEPGAASTHIFWKGSLPQLEGAQVLGGAFQPGKVFVFYGRQPSESRYVLAIDRKRQVRYAFDFANYVWPPRIRPSEREFVYEQVVWAHEAGGVLYVENAHSTYASSSYGRNAYVTAIDLKTKKRLWRSPALVANADTFLVTDRYLITGYGFTAEPDYLYLLDRKTGEVVDRLDLPSAPERIIWRGKQVRVRTYDHEIVVKLAGTS